MREIKLRAWIPEKQKMVYFDHLYYCGEYNSLAFRIREEDEEIKGANHCFPVEPRIENVMEYSGLKDKNGKEIYEGDIIEHFTTYNGFGSSSIVQYGVEPYVAWYVVSPKGEALGLLTMYPGKVIGNIHQNPELLKELGEAKK